MAHCSCIGKKVVRALYNYAPSVVAGGDEAENDLNFNKGDVMIVIKEYVCLSVHVYVCVCVCVCVCVGFFVCRLHYSNSYADDFSRNFHQGKRRRSLLIFCSQRLDWYQNKKQVVKVI